jgi:hypothetical protein
MRIVYAKKRKIADVMIDAITEAAEDDRRIETFYLTMAEFEQFKNEAPFPPEVGGYLFFGANVKLEGW